MAVESQYPMLSTRVENPPVETAAKEWLTASKKDMPAIQYAMVPATA